MFVALSIGGPAQTPRTAVDYRISGKVVNADTGAPLDRAEVAIATAGQAPDQGPETRSRGRRGVAPALQSAITGEDGSFMFEHVPAGKYALTGSRRGFITENYQQHGSFFTSIVTGPRLDSEHLLLKLRPGAVIAGSITDTLGDPVEQAAVSLYRLADDGLGSILRYRSAQSDDQGAYEFGHLSPGTYFVAAASRVWYATQPSQVPGLVAAASGNLDVVFPRSYYADATDSSAATPIPVRGGERLRADLHMHAQPAVHLSYALPGPPGEDGNRGVQAPVLSEQVFSGRDAAPGPGNSRVQLDEHGAQSLTLSVAVGTYEVEAGGHTLAVNASGDMQLDMQGGSAGVSVSGKVAGAPHTELSEAVELSLQASHESGDPINATRSRDGNFTFEHVTPGTYELVARGEGQVLAVMQMAASGAALDGHMLKVGTQPVTLAATLAPAKTEITGFARRATGAESEQAAPGSMIVLVPEHPEEHSLYRRDQADSDGSFALRDVPAGRYTLVAIEDGWDLDWATAAVIAHYLPGGMGIKVSGVAREVVHPARALMVQPR